LPLIYGAALLTVLAAIVEGFWSAEPLPPAVKYTFGICGWVACITYLSLAGRRLEDAA
jgi:hypothetical protein